LLPQRRFVSVQPIKRVGRLVHQLKEGASEVTSDFVGIGPAAMLVNPTAGVIELHPVEMAITADFEASTAVVRELDLRLASAP
jgi:hypothetical protein